MATTYRHAQDLDILLARHLDFLIKDDAEGKRREWRGESLLCWESLGDGEMQEVARINSARPGRFGGEEGKKFAAARKRPAFEVRVFPAPGRARCTGQPQSATGVHGNHGERWCSLQPCRGAKRFAMPVKPEGPVLVPIAKLAAKRE
jgi:hypothetical protein